VNPPRATGSKELHPHDFHATLYATPRGGATVETGARTAGRKDAAESAGATEETDMLDRKFVREHPDLVRAAIEDKGEAADLDAFLELESARLQLLVDVESLKAQRNAASEEIGRSKKEGEDATRAIAEMKQVSQAIKEGDHRLADLEAELSSLEKRFPNLPDDDVPRGGEEKNVVVRTWREPRRIEALPHWEIGERWGMLHLEAASRMSGSGFGLLTGALARLERALINWFLDVHVREQGYVEMNAPYLVREQAVFGTGQLPKLSEDMYLTREDGLWLIPTAEVSVTNFFADEILEPSVVPVRFVAFSPCFRREAGSAGKDTRGILRVHQFHKVEMVRFTTPSQSDVELEELVSDATMLLEQLDLPYRVVKLASRDLSFAAAKCFDLEVYSPGVDQWLEVSSCSTFRDFQARRANIRYRPEPGAKPLHVHTLNGSGLALPRTIVAILENFQTQDGRVRIPEVLRPYMDGATHLG
jgi:seryl-tRNA synthetase